MSREKRLSRTGSFPRARKSVVALTKIYENPKIMALKQKLDKADGDGDGILTLSEWMTHYSELCSDHHEHRAIAVAIADAIIASSHTSNTTSDPRLQADMDAYRRGEYTPDQLIALQHFRLLRPANPQQLTWLEFVTACCTENPVDLIPLSILEYLQREFKEMDRDTIGMISRQQYEARYPDAAWSFRSSSTRPSKSKVSQLRGDWITMETFIQHGIGLYVNHQYRVEKQDVKPGHVGRIRASMSIPDPKETSFAVVFGNAGLPRRRHGTVSRSDISVMERKMSTRTTISMICDAVNSGHFITGPHQLTLTMGQVQRLARLLEISTSSRERTPIIHPQHAVVMDPQKLQTRINQIQKKRVKFQNAVQFMAAMKLLCMDDITPAQIEYEASRTNMPASTVQQLIHLIEHDTYTSNDVDIIDEKEPPSHILSPSQATSITSASPSFSFRQAPISPMHISIDSTNHDHLRISSGPSSYNQRTYSVLPSDTNINNNNMSTHTIIHGDLKIIPSMDNEVTIDVLTEKINTCRMIKVPPALSLEEMEELILACSIDMNHLDLHHIDIMESHDLKFDSARQLLYALQLLSLSEVDLDEVLVEIEKQQFSNPVGIYIMNTLLQSDSQAYEDTQGRPASPSRRRHIATHQHLLSVSSVDEGDLLPVSEMIEMDIHERLADLHIDNDLVYQSIRAAVQQSSGKYIDMLINKICDAAVSSHLITTVLTSQDIEEIGNLFPPPQSPSCRSHANNIAAKALHHIKQMQLQHIELDTPTQLIQALTLLCCEPDQHITMIPTSFPPQAVTYVLSHSAWDQQQLRSILTSQPYTKPTPRTALATPLALNLTSQSSYMTESPHSAHYSIHMIDSEDDMNHHMISIDAPPPLSTIHKHTPKKSVTIMPLHHITDEHYQIYDETQDEDGMDSARIKRAHEIKKLTESIQMSGLLRPTPSSRPTISPHTFTPVTIPSPSTDSYLINESDIIMIEQMIDSGVDVDRVCAQIQKMVDTKRVTRSSVAFTSASDLLNAVSNSLQIFSPSHSKHSSLSQFPTSTFPTSTTLPIGTTSSMSMATGRDVAAALKPMNGFSYTQGNDAFAAILHLDDGTDDMESPPHHQHGTHLSVTTDGSDDSSEIQGPPLSPVPASSCFACCSSSSRPLPSLPLTKSSSRGSSERHLATSSAPMSRKGSESTSTNSNSTRVQTNRECIML